MLQIQCFTSSAAIVLKVLTEKKESLFRSRLITSHFLKSVPSKNLSLLQNV